MASVRQCFRYITKRPGQFNYQEATAAKLPIGSGEVESAHRYVVQERLKLPGAWWLKDNAQPSKRRRQQSLGPLLGCLGRLNPDQQFQLHPSCPAISARTLSMSSAIACSIS